MLTAFFIALLLLTIWLVVLLRQRKSQQLKHSELETTISLQQKKLIDQTEQWRSAAETLEHANRQHQMTMALLNETKEYLDSIINSMPSVIIGVTPSGHITHWNTSAENATSIREHQALGYRLKEVFPDLPASDNMIKEAINQAEPQSEQAVQFIRNGEIKYLDITVYPLNSPHLTGAVIRLDNVTARQQMEGMMIQNEKLRSLGELAAGMAHEINNPLAAILQSLQNVQRRLNPNNVTNQKIAETYELDLKIVDKYLNQREIPHFLNGMETAGRRAAEILRNMLEFARGSSQQLKPTQINDVVNQSVDFIHDALKLSMPSTYKRLDIKTDLSSNIPKTLAAPLEIQQVLVNMLKNGAQAIQQAKPESPLLAISTALKPPYIEIRVSDNGIGMDANVSRQVFDPFYTTKTVGQGTGLGLSISHFIIFQRHNGKIEVESSLGCGTTFIISLPITQ